MSREETIILYFILRYYVFDNGIKLGLQM